jgi:hypothetical protein
MGLRPQVHVETKFGRPASTFPALSDMDWISSGIAGHILGSNQILRLLPSLVTDKARGYVDESNRYALP